MTKRAGVGLIYFIVVVMTLLLRVSTALGVTSGMGAFGDVYFTLIVQVLIFGALPIGLYYLFVKRRDPKPWLGVARDFGVKKVSGRNWWRIAAITVAMIFISFGFSYVWSTLLAAIGYKSGSSGTDYSSIAVLFQELFFTAVLPAVFEENTHRGLLFAGYRECGWKFVLVSALLFSLMHQNIVQTGYTFFDGAAMALVMYYTGSVWPGVFMHFTNNFVSVVSGYVTQNGGFLSFLTTFSEWLLSTVGGYVTCVCLVMIAALVIVIMFKRMRADAVKNGVIGEIPFAPAQEGALPLRKDVFFIVTVLVGVAATAFSLVWGIMR